MAAKVLAGGLCFAAEAFASFSRSLHPVFILELRRREGGREASSSSVAMESGEGRVCGAQEPPDLHARLPEKPSPVSPVGFVFITRQTFNYFTFMLLLNRLRELQKIMHFYFYILY